MSVAIFRFRRPVSNDGTGDRLRRSIGTELPRLAATLRLRRHRWVWVSAASTLLLLAAFGEVRWTTLVQLRIRNRWASDAFQGITVGTSALYVRRLALGGAPPLVSRVAPALPGLSPSVGTNRQCHSLFWRGRPPVSHFC